jgi:uncharacterized membrane protein YdbT with pleckstrin-like domain
MDNVLIQENIQELIGLLNKEKTLKDFRDAFMSTEDLAEFAARARFQVHDQGTRVIRQGERGREFFIVMSGQLRAVDTNQPKPRLLGYFTTGAIVGERALLHDRIRTATVEVVVSAKLAWFGEDDWYWLIGKNSRFKDYFENLEAYRLEQSAKDFPGRQYDEVIVASTKRHYTAYIATLPLPIGLLIIPVFIALTVILVDPEFLSDISAIIIWLAAVPFVFTAILLAIYNYFDWLNDDFIVTTKRIVHIERFLFFGEKREDAPLTRIQDITTISDILDLVFDSDSLQIQTAGAGTIIFNHIRQASYIQQVIFIERDRAKARVASADVAALRHNIAQQIHWEEKLEENVLSVAEPEAIVIHHPKTQHYNRFIDYFVPRIKEVNEDKNGTIIVWRKHYYVLLANITLPFLTLLFSIYLFIASFALSIPPFYTAVSWPIQTILGVAVAASLLWYLVKYDDWNKDIYILTNTQIIDIESAAFRIRKKRREGTFDNIQGVYSEIPNLFSKLLNMGDVIIETAGTAETFTFKKVFDPASVREEVFNRWAAYQQKEREKLRDATNRQVMEVLKEYHKLISKA